MTFDYVLVGGGLQSALIALALRARRPEATLAVVEREVRLGGNHTWSFHEGDVAAASLAWLEPLVAHRWDAYDVRFPGLQRRLDHGYASLTSARLDQVLRETIAASPGSALLLEAEAVELGRQRVVLRDGRELQGALVVDARGPEASLPVDGQGYQKFLGLELRLERPAPQSGPTLMDATVEQKDGFRFVYVLPFAPDRVLIEDTYYSDTPALDRETLRARVHAYALARGFAVKTVLREETGVLPIPWVAPKPVPSEGALRAGYAGGFFHPTTGYSLPVAVRVAERLAACPLEVAPRDVLAALARHHERQARFCRVLNWLLFCAYPQGERWQVLQRFYRLPEATIRRFYALDLTLADRARLLLGRPPGGLSWRAAWSSLQAA